MSGDDEAIRLGFLRFTRSKSKSERPKVEDQDNLGGRKSKATAGKKLLGVWLNPAAIKQFNLLAAERDVQKQELMAEALNMLFEHYHKPKIA